MSGSVDDFLELVKVTQKDCEHRVIRKKRSEHHTYTFDAYVCGSCAKIFEVNEYVEPLPEPKEPMFPKHSIPWGLRGRQA